MRLTVFGATGRIGAEMVRQAQASGHKVTAVARRSSKLEISDPALTVVRVDGLGDPRQLVPALEGSDAALSGVGPRSSRDLTVASSSTRAILTALKLAGVGRFVAVSAWPVGPIPEGESLLGRRVLHPMMNRILKRVYADLRRMEEEIAASGLEWTVVRPPRLTDGPLTHRYQTKVGGNVVNARIVSRADVAHCMLNALDDPETIGQPVGIAR
ncbi:MAG TPA: NAD(P)H-binding protein [Candidatus Limnocylindrales bacterium]|nr:NAD(P)H-binding protein [Candidatus Limnocylindrales bacterium]